jgi:hypothetical protein
MRRFFLSYFFLINFLLTSLTTVSAQTQYTTQPDIIVSTGSTGYIRDSCGFFRVEGCKDIFELLLGAIIPSLAILVYGIGAVMILVNAISLITSAGDQNKAKEAFKKIQANIVGFLVLILAGVIFYTVINLVSIPIMEASRIVYL